MILYYLDASAWVKRYYAEAGTPSVEHLFSGEHLLGCSSLGVVEVIAALSRKHKELIAVGISVTIDCESCMQWHIEKAVEHGATLEEVLEAVDVAIMMGNGATTVRARFAMDVMKDVFPNRV